MEGLVRINTQPGFQERLTRYEGTSEPYQKVVPVSRVKTVLNFFYEFERHMNARATILAASMAAVLVVSMTMNPAYATWVTANAPEDDFTGLEPDTNADFDIETVGITNDGNLRMTVYGTIGGTIPEHDSRLVNAYVFFTDVGIVVLTSHIAEDSAQVEDDLEWHSHRVSLEDGCVISIEDFGKAKFKLDGMAQILQTGASSIDLALTAQLPIDHMKMLSSL